MAFAAAGRTRIDRRRICLAALGAALAAGPLAGCGQEEKQARLWHDGVLVVGTGNTTGVYYQVGGGYADAITNHVEGYEGLVAPTAGSADNLLRLDAGDVDIALTFADVAADAIRGTGAFTGSAPKIRGIASIYRSFTHLIVRSDANIDSVADLRGKRVSTGTLNSGTEFLAMRLLRAAGVNPDKDLKREKLSLPATTRGLSNGTLDATFWSGGVPTVGISELLGAARGEVRFLPLDDMLEKLEGYYPGTYAPGAISAAAYKLPKEVPTVTVSNLIVVPERLPERLAYDLTALIFQHQQELAAAHPQWGTIEAFGAAQTGVVPLHPGSDRYYRHR